MNALAQLSAGISALVLIAVFPTEAFLIDRPRVQKLLGIEPHGIENVHLWSFCIGARNALAGVGTLIGLGMVNYGDESTGTTVHHFAALTCVPAQDKQRPAWFRVRAACLVAPGRLFPCGHGSEGRGCAPSGVATSASGMIRPGGTFAGVSFPAFGKDPP